MKKLALAAVAVLAFTGTSANATSGSWYDWFYGSSSSSGGHTHYYDCGHCSGKKNCGSSSGGSTGGTTTGGTTTGGTTTGGTTTGGTTTGGTTTSGGSTGGTQVPEPGLFAMFAAGAVAMGIARRRRRNNG